MCVLLQGEGGRCFSRAEPRHKQDIVRLLKEMGEVRSLLRPAALRMQLSHAACASVNLPTLPVIWHVAGLAPSL